MRSKPTAVESETTVANTVETWPIDRLVPYVNNPRKNDSVVEQMSASIEEFGFKIPILARTVKSWTDTFG
jgi:ParB-like chromosome segregation protein Spo0J